MREILFRGKCNETCKYNGQWIEGFYGEDDGKPIIAHSTDRGLIGYFCDPDSIGQYTGLTDKNGKKIFEGDIVKVENNDYDWYEHDPNSYSVFAVDFDEGGYTVGSYFLQNWLWFDEFRGEVIGNIHDNPELLEVKE